MLALASIMLGFGAIVCGYYQAPDRWPAKAALPSRRVRQLLGVLAIVGLGASLALAVAAEGWAAGIGLWLAALMAAGVVVVSLAGQYPGLTRRLGIGAAAAALVLVVIHWANP